MVIFLNKAIPGKNLMQKRQNHPEMVLHSSLPGKPPELIPKFLSNISLTNLGVIYSFHFKYVNK